MMPNSCNVLKKFWTRSWSRGRQIKVLLLKERVDAAGRLTTNELQKQTNTKRKRHPSDGVRGDGDRDRDDDIVEAGMPVATYRRKKRP